MGGSRLSGPLKFVLNDQVMKLSIITTCKGRLHYLVQSLPTFLCQPNTEVIVVDYDCPQHTAKVVADQFPAVKIVHLTDRPSFNVSEARNVGAAAATAPVLAFVDADIVLSGNFAEHVADWSPHAYGEFIGPNDVRGTCVAPAKAFRHIGGYDEVMTGYGAEDLDLYERFRLLGLARIELAKELLAGIQLNTPEERLRYHDIGRKLGFARGRAYRDLKLLLIKISGQLELDISLRRELWAKLDEIVRSPDIFKQEHFVEIPLPSLKQDGMLPGCVFGPSVRMSIKLAR